MGGVYMKIKTVCEMTGLTDRTIRYYIEEQLIFPEHTENYLGRRSFDFSQADVDTLRSISILRKFDFMIDEIRQIIRDETASIFIIANVRERAKQAIAIGEEKFQALSLLSEAQSYTLEQLAEELSRLPNNLPEQPEEIRWKPVKFTLNLIKYLFIATIIWAPILLSVLVVIYSVRWFHYPVIDFLWFSCTIVSFFPSVAIMATSGRKKKWKIFNRRVLLVLCAVSIPISTILSCGIITRSETTNILDYRRLDVDCLANRDPFYQDLFPLWPNWLTHELQADGSLKEVHLDARYYYCNKPAFDYTYDIYAQWPLEKAKFEEEVARVTALFEERIDDGHFVTMQKGNYTCLIAHSYDPPFEKVTESYTYHIFAYDETNLIVRYILCDSLENGEDQPYYLSLDW